MDTFSVNITIDDCCYNKCHTSNVTTTKIFTSLSDYIAIQNCYYLKIIAIAPTYVILSIDNGTLHFVRKAYIQIPLKICLPNNCSCHKITIKINSITS